MDSDGFHCSPLHTGPKGEHSRRVILGLSYPLALPVNSQITKFEFDNLPFVLKFPTIDDIIDHILKYDEEICLFKMAIAWVFQNLRVDPGEVWDQVGK